MEDQYRDYDEYAGFWMRFVAYLIDGIILNVVIYFFIIIMGVFTVGPVLVMADDVDNISPIALGGSFMMILFVAVIGSWLYYALQESSIHQATLGKRAMRLYVTMENGERINFTQASIRFFSKIISGLIFMVGYILAAFTERKQALHDIIAKTLVYKST